MIEGLVGIVVRQLAAAFLSFVERQLQRLRDKAEGAREAAAKQKDEQNARLEKAREARDSSLRDNPDGLRDDRDLRD